MNHDMSKEGVVVVKVNLIKAGTREEVLDAVEGVAEATEGVTTRLPSRVNAKSYKTTSTRLVTSVKQTSIPRQLRQFYVTSRRPSTMAMTLGRHLRH